VDQRVALERLWTAQEGGWLANLVGLLGTLRNLEYAQIVCRIENDLARWSIDVPGRVSGAVDALTGPTTPSGQRVQTHNPPGSETGGSPATWGVPAKMELVDFGVLGEWEAGFAFVAQGQAAVSGEPGHGSFASPSGVCRACPWLRCLCGRCGP
jgi:hypothetical protein